MIKEYQSIMNNYVWDVVPRPEGKSVINSKWIYKIKHAIDGSIEKYKARFVARGFSQNEGLGYDALFSRHGAVAECGCNLPRKREVCSRDPQEVWDDVLQGHDHTYGIEPEAIE